MPQTLSQNFAGVKLLSAVFQRYAYVQSTYDYFPFGSPLPERGYDGAGYKFGFNGKENDNEVYGDGNFQDYGMRMYDTRVVRFISTDPIIVFNKRYPYLSPFQFAANTPIQAIDLDGLENIYFSKGLDSSPSRKMLIIAKFTTVYREMYSLLKNQSYYDLYLFTYDDYDYATASQGVTMTYTNAETHYDELYESAVDKEVLKATLDAGKGLIAVGLTKKYEDAITSNNYLDKVSEKKGSDVRMDNYREGAYTWAHEFGAHVINTLKGINLDQKTEHKNFQGEDSNKTSEVVDLEKKPGFQETPGGKSLKEIDSAMKKYNSFLKR